MLRSLTLALLLLASLLWAIIFVTPRHYTLAADVDRTTATSTGITVTTTTDELNEDGDCALREAIQAAYTDASVDSCPAGSGGDTIYLPEGRILLLDQLNLTGTVSIVGSVQGTSILEGNFSRIFYIYPDAIVTLLRLQITNGYAPHEPCYSNCSSMLTWGGGGGIANYGTTTIIDSTIYGNKAGLGEPQGSEAVNGAHGGGIYNAGTLTLTNSTISNNAAGDGRYFCGKCFFVYCARGGEGGGIANFGTLTLDNATVTENQPGTTAYIAEVCGLDAKNKKGSVGGIYNRSLFRDQEATITLKNTILAGNDVADCSGNVTSLDHNLIANSFNCTLTGNYLHLWAGLGPLQENGGPTLTHALHEKSPAINTGICTNSAGVTVTTDQRGEARPQGGACDIGAVESPYTRTVEILDMGLPFIKR